MASVTSTDIYARVFGDPTEAMPSGMDQTVFANENPEHEEIAQRVMRDIAGSEGSYQAWENLAREENNYYHGHQWDDIDRMRMEQTKRPAITFNEIKPTINAVSGLERLNRTDVLVQTRALDSQPVADIAGDLATAAISTADDLCNAAEEDSNVAKTAAITGMAWGEVRMDYTSDINGRVVYEQFDCFEARWDPNCRKPNLEDSDWRARKREFSRRKFEKMWPGKLPQVDMTVPDLPYGETQKYELVTPYYSIRNEKANPQVGNQTNAKKTVTVIQYQWRDMQPIYRFQDQDSGEITTLSEEKWDRMEKRLKEIGATPPAAVRQLQPVYRQCYVSRGVMLEDPVDLPGGWSLICMTGEWDGEKKRYVGLTRDMIDPQKTKNKAISAALQFHITNAKGGVIFKPKMFDDPIQAKDQWSAPDAWIAASDEADLAADFKQREPSRMPPELPMFYSEATKEISRTSGINEEMVGIQTSQIQPQTNRNRSQAGLVVLGWYWDNLYRHRRERAGTTLEFIREFWTQGQWLSIGGDVGNGQPLQLLKESLPEQNAYSMVLDESVRHNPNLKAQIWTELMDSGVFQALMKFGAGRVILQLLKFSPFPAQVVRMINQDMQENPPQPPQKGRGKQDDPTLTQAKAKLFDAQREKALAQARQIDQSNNLKLAELVGNSLVEAKRLKQQDQLNQHRANMDVRKAWTQGMGTKGF